MPPQELREYQARAKTRILESYRNGARSILVVSPTGSGKTTLFGDMVSDLSHGGVPCLINVHRRELATQAANRLREFGVQYGLIMAGEQPRPSALVQIASVQSLIRRRMPRANFVVNDEAHLSAANTWTTILQQYAGARILGVTATPWRLSGTPLAALYDDVVVVAQPAELRDQGFLCKYAGFSFKTPDLTKVRTTAGDYNEQDSAQAMSDGAIVDNIVEEWLKHASHLSTVVFAVTVAHSKVLTDRFKAAGVAAEHLDGSTAKWERDAILKRVESGKTQVLCNVGVAVEGLDIPRLKCCVLARPTKSLARAIQMMGRVRRPWKDPTTGQWVAARIHDHAFVIKQHGLPDDPRDYSIDAKKQKPVSDLEELHQCKKCFAWYRGVRCSECQAEREIEERVIATIKDAEQWEFASGDEKPVTPEESKPFTRPERPTPIRWETVGRVIEGAYLKFWDEPTNYGKQRRYLVRSEKRDYDVPGTTELDYKMSRTPVGALIRITYTGDTGRRKNFNVGVDDGQPTATRGNSGDDHWTKRQPQITDEQFYESVHSFTEHCILDKYASVTVDEMETAWLAWAKQSRHHPETRTFWEHLLKFPGVSTGQGETPRHILSGIKFKGALPHQLRTQSRAHQKEISSAFKARLAENAQ